VNISQPKLRSEKFDDNDDDDDDNNNPLSVVPKSGRLNVFEMNCKRFELILQPLSKILPSPYWRLL